MLKLNMTGRKFDVEEIREDLHHEMIKKLAEEPWGLSKYNRLADKDLDRGLVGEEVRVYGADLETQYRFWDLESEMGIRVTFEK